jgi:predicted O-methyltransferase YrrM
MTQLKRWQDIPGWFNELEAKVIRAFCTGADVIEFGSWMGRSTCAISDVANHVTAIDSFQGDSQTGKMETVDCFIANIKGRSNVRLMMTTIEKLDPFDPTYDVAFVDVEHTFPCTLMTLKLARGAVKPGGYIFWHDHDQPEVRRAVAAAGLRPIQCVERLAWGRN